MSLNFNYACLILALFFSVGCGANKGAKADKSGSSLPSVYVYSASVGDKKILKSVGSVLSEIKTIYDLTLIGKSYGEEPQIETMGIFENNPGEFILVVGSKHLDNPPAHLGGVFFLVFVVDDRVVSVIEAARHEVNKPYEDRATATMMFISKEVAENTYNKYPATRGFQVNLSSEK